MAFRLVDRDTHYAPLSTAERSNQILTHAIHSLINISVNISVLGNDSVLLRLLSKYAHPLPELPARRAKAIFRVSVLGVSTTAGCGAAESWLDVLLPVANASSKSCAPMRSWARQMYEELLEEFHETPGAKSRLAVEVFPLNAAVASAHGDCASSRVKRDTSLILLEVATNLFNTDVRELILRVRATAPAAVILFVAWPSQSWLKQMSSRETGWPCCDFKRILDACHVGR